jgi:pimeloyl-ACP methyl ester carboxylesterase
MTVDHCASDILALMSHLEIDRGVIGGLSMGGYVALAVVNHAPQRVEGLVLANTRAGADSPEGRAGRDRMIDLVRREGPSAVAREMLPKLLGETTKRDQPDLVDVVRGLAEANTADGLAAAIHAMKTRPDSTPMLGSIRCPTLVITSDEDTLIPSSESEKMAAAIPGARLHVIAHAGHLSNLEKPKEFSKALFQ